MSKRSPYDFYPTPEGSINSLLDRLKLYNIDLGSTILEPCIGDGALIDPILQYFPSVEIHGFDIDNSHYNKLTTILNENKIKAFGFKDILSLTQEEFNCYDTIITNPPFSSTQEILEHILELKKNSPRIKYVIILQRLGFLGAQKRHEFWNKYPPNAVWALSKRPSFTGNGTDAHEYGWFIWGDLDNAPPVIAI